MNPPLDTTPHGAERGLSSIEAMIVLIIFGIVSTASFALFGSGIRVFARESVVTGLQNDVVAAQNAFLDEMLIAGFSPDGVATNATALPEVSTSGSLDSVQFIADIDSNAVSDRVTYAVSDGNLRRTIEPRVAGEWGPPVVDTLLTGVDQFQLTFLDKNRASLTDAQVEAGGVSTARFVRVTLSSTGTARAQTLARTLLGEVSFRN